MKIVRLLYGWNTDYKGHHREIAAWLRPILLDAYKKAKNSTTKPDEDQLLEWARGAGFWAQEKAPRGSGTFCLYKGGWDPVSTFSLNKPVPAPKDDWQLRIARLRHKLDGASYPTLGMKFQLERLRECEQDLAILITDMEGWQSNEESAIITEAK